MQWHQWLCVELNTINTGCNMIFSSGVCQNPWSSCNEKEFYNKNVSCLPRPCSFFHCPWRVGMELCFAQNRLELHLYHWVSVLSTLKPWADFGYPWLLLVWKLLYPFPQWHLGNSWINMGCAYSEYHCGRKPGVMQYRDTFIYLTEVVYLELFMRFHSTLVNFVKAMESW